MKMKFHLAASAACIAAAAISAPAFAQSTGSVDFEDDVIVVTGAYERDVGGVEIPDTPKAKQVLDQEIISRQRPGQTVNDIVNLVPGVSFQNNDPWGSSGGSFTIRGFNSDRISQTLDGLPLNDSGNYALYTNQQVDPEILDEVNVNLGTTDVDSPTASAVGGTINIRTRRPSMDPGFMMSTSYGNILSNGSGDRPYYRAFAMLDTGDFTGIGTSAFISGSLTTYENPFNNYGRVYKKQANGRIFQELGDNGDFVSVAAHYNENRNNFFGSFRVTDFPTTKEDRFYEIDYPCSVDLPTAGVRDIDNNCGAEFDRRFNPSNTGNIRGSSLFTLADGLVLSIDPSFQYVKANGGGDEELEEGRRFYNGVGYTGFLRGGYWFGMDLNGDGDMLDQVTGHDPSQTKTRRYGVISSLAYEVNDSNRIRLAYTWDRANHRQTGPTSVAFLNGDIQDVFPINNPQVTADGFVLNKRDRQSYAILHQVSGEYLGRFMDDALTVVLGVRAPFFTRELNQNCYTTSASGFLDCFSNQDPTAYEAANPNAALPQSRTYKYDKLLPNLGFTYQIGDASVFGNYAKGLSVPGTDPLYDSLYFPANTPGVQPAPETTDSFDLGLRFQRGDIQAQVAGWFTKYNNRLASAYDPELDETIFRNLGRVDKYGIDGSVAWRPSDSFLFYVFGSLTESEIKDNIDADGAVLQTAGKRESGAPTYMLGARGQVSLGGFDFGAQVKRTGKRFINDENLPLRDDIEVNGEELSVVVYPASVAAYTLVDLDISYVLMTTEAGGDITVQANLTNLFDELYVGGFGGSLDAGNTPFVQIGAPRAASISLIAQF